MRWWQSGLVSLLLAGLWCSGAAAQDERIGLVLSGGGARGFAHIGVIRALEERGIQVNAITGTSMGAIVGALYASGKNVAELEDIARTTDWAYAFTDNSPRTDQPYIFRQLDAGLAADYRLLINQGRVVFPRGVIQGQHLTQILDELFAHVDRLRRFDQLPIPFKAIAADLVTGEEVVMDRGRLSTAVRASMSIPGLLEPVEWQGKLLVDGGIANNMPVGVIQQMGVDRLIVVDVGSPARSLDEITSVLEVVDQLTGMLVRQSAERERKLMQPDDVFIRPPLSITNASFGDADVAMEAGYSATVAALEAAGWAAAAPLPSVEERVSFTPTRIDFIEVVNDGPVAERVVRNLIRQPLGEPLDTERLKQDISEIYALDYFREIRHEVVRRDGKAGLRIVAHRREAGSNFLRIGLRLSDDFNGNTDFGLGASLRMAGLNHRGGTAFFRGDIGTTPRFEARFLQPLDHHMNYFIEPLVMYQSDRIELFDSNLQPEALASYERSERGMGLFVGRQWLRLGEFRAGVVRRRGRLDFRSGIDQGNVHFSDGYYSARLGWDSLDNLAFPTGGARWAAEWQWHDPGIGAPSSFNRWELGATWAHTMGPLTMLLEGDLKTADSNDLGVTNLLPIGGFLELSGIAPRSRWGQHRALTRLVALTPLGEKTPLPSPVPLYLGASLERGNVWETREEMRWSDATMAGSVFLGARTPLGPAYLSVGFAEGGDYSVNIFLGELFR